VLKSKQQGKGVGMLKAKEVSPFIVAISGLNVTEEERETLLQLNPVGYILFARNCDNAQQVKELCDDLKSISSHHTPLIFIDQEGGRVKRIEWDDYIGPAGKTIGDIYKQDKALGLELAQKNGYVIAAQLAAYGINVNCLPLADVRHLGMHDVIGDRAFSDNPEDVAALCAATISGQLAGGVWSIIKHAPGHGRATADSHLELPEVDVPFEDLMKSDFYPFKVNNQCPFIMTAHIRYPQLDGKCATDSKYVLDDVLRGALGMTGLIVSDDLNMEALEGTIRERAVRAMDAGCELMLQCSGRLEDLQQLVDLPAITDGAMEKLSALPTLGKFDDQLLEESKDLLREHLK
jgi:beta-N-acetylhexosaminidase